MQKKEWSSFSSLPWKRVSNAAGELLPHRWTWNSHMVFGVGVNQAGLGGHWRCSTSAEIYRTHTCAQAAVEIYELERNPPELLEEHVERVIEKLNQVIAASFEHLLRRTGLSEGTLSDALMQALDDERIKVVFVKGRAGYKLK